MGYFLSKWSISNCNRHFEDPDQATKTKGELSSTDPYGDVYNMIKVLADLKSLAPEPSV